MFIATALPLWVSSTCDKEKLGRICFCWYTALFPGLTGTYRSYVLVVTLLADHSNTSSKRTCSKCLKAEIFSTVDRQRVYSIEFMKSFLVDYHALDCGLLTKSEVEHLMLP